MESERDKREVRKVLYFERYSPVILRILMYGEVNKKNLARHYFQIGVIFCPKTKNIYWKRNLHGTAVGITVVRFFIEIWYACTYMDRRRKRTHD